MNKQKQLEHQELLNLVTNIWSALILIHDPADISRIRLYLDVIVGLMDAPLDSDDRSFFPRLFFPGLTSQPFVHVPGLDQSVPDATLMAMAKEKDAALGCSKMVVDHSDMLADGQWHCFYLIREFEVFERSRFPLPVTTEFLKSRKVASEALYSRLLAGSCIPSHSDRINYILTVHVPLNSAGASITVGGVTRQYVEGVPVCFDSSFIHSVASPNANRDILLFNVWHPGWTGAEASALSYIWYQWDLSYEFNPDISFMPSSGGCHE